MLMKNLWTKSDRLYNGLIGVVDRLTLKSVFVKFRSWLSSIELEPEVFER